MRRLARLVGRDRRPPAAAVRAAWLDAAGHPEGRPANLGFRAWLLGLVLRQLANEQAAGSAGRAIDPDEFEGDDDRWAGHWKDDRPRPLSLSERRIEDALTRLPPGLAAIIVLRDVEDLPSSEVQAIIGYTGEQMRALLHRGRVAIRSALEATEATS